MTTATATAEKCRAARSTFTAPTELIEYTTAEQLAAVYQSQVAKIREHAAAMGAASTALIDAFGESSRYGFRVELSRGSGSRQTYAAHNAEEIEKMIERMKRGAWGAIIDKLAIKRLMSAARVKELDLALEGHGGQDFPDITPDTIREVAAGYVGSANEFLEEAVKEEYDFWKPCRTTKYKTNSGPFTLGPKIIKGYMVESCNYRGSYWRVGYYNSHHLTALDSIFHMLDGQGPVTSYKGDLTSAIETADASGAGETKYFSFRCFQNGNLHLKFLRADLLSLFNSIAGRNRLPGADSGSDW